jgi:putative peptidoglycan binding protein
MAREAYSLQQLETELQEFYPGTTTWEVGDKRHQASYSDHNENSKGVYCAKDVLPNGGLNLRAFVMWITANPHPNLRYVIFDHKIYERRNHFQPRDYNGTAAHETWVHVSVGNGPDGRSTEGYDSRATWGISYLGKNVKPVKPSKPVSKGWTDKLMSDLPTLKRGAKSPLVGRMQALLNTYGAGLKEDDDFGPATGRELRDFQRDKDLTVDEHCGKNTWSKLVKG